MQSTISLDESIKSPGPVAAPLFGEGFDLGISEIAADDVCHSVPVVVVLKPTTVQCHNLLELLPP